LGVGLTPPPHKNLLLGKPKKMDAGQIYRNEHSEEKGNMSYGSEGLEKTSPK
jgi:hypothetical protein